MNIVIIMVITSGTHYHFLLTRVKSTILDRCNKRNNLFKQYLFNEYIYFKRPLYSCLKEVDILNEDGVNEWYLTDLNQRGS